MIKKIWQLLCSFGKHFSSRKVIAPIFIAVAVLCATGSAFSVETYIIRDGDETKVCKSYEKDADVVLSETGVQVSNLDEVTVSENADGEIEIKILRAGTVNISVDGQTKLVTVRHDDTVSKALERAGITLGELDELSVGAENKVEYGSTVGIVRVAVSEQTKSVEIPFESEVKENNQKDAGQTTVLQEGQKGEKQQVYQVTTRDGVVVSETLMREEVVKEPVTQIVEKGTKTKVTANVVGGSGTISSRDGTFRYTKVIEVTATAYSAEEHYTNQYTATGARARVGLIAVDPKVIPLGTRMYITSLDGKSWIYGYAVAADTGGAIKGNKIDLYFNTVRECNNFGRRRAKVYILE